MECDGDVSPSGDASSPSGAHSTPQASLPPNQQLTSPKVPKRPGGLLHSQAAVLAAGGGGRILFVRAPDSVHTDVGLGAMKYCVLAVVFYSLSLPPWFLVEMVLLAGDSQAGGNAPRIREGGTSLRGPNHLTSPTSESCPRQPPTKVLFFLPENYSAFLVSLFFFGQLETPLGLFNKPLAAGRVLPAEFSLCERGQISSNWNYQQRWNSRMRTFSPAWCRMFRMCAVHSSAEGGGRAQVFS